MFKFLSDHANLYLSGQLDLKWLISVQLLRNFWSHILWSASATLVKAGVWGKHAWRTITSCMESYHLHTSLTLCLSSHRFVLLEELREAF